ncbi:hypothetical protein Nepgr_033405 [Nepenthes gracilis]|uniref:Uncharacterized protein n=1 Tax=Nepenthes gracilis TaxID=150966 RepID=A0AAD3Y8Y7_NEPGR|nr:hypothetical protein Nepgr_033405 [Nepenthes gracilis]
MLPSTDDKERLRLQVLSRPSITAAIRVGSSQIDTEATWWLAGGRMRSGGLEVIEDEVQHTAGLSEAAPD